MSIPLGRTCAAAAAGIVTVAAADNALELALKDQAPPFETSFEGASRFKQDTFLGRMQKMMLACDPTLLVYTASHVRSLKAKLDAFRSECDANGALIEIHFAIYCAFHSALMLFRKYSACSPPME